MWFMIQHDAPSQTSQVWPHKGTESRLPVYPVSPCTGEAEEPGAGKELWRRRRGLMCSGSSGNSFPGLITPHRCLLKQPR